VVGRFLTLCRALVSAACAGELVGLSARGLAEAEVWALGCEDLGGSEAFDALASSRLGRSRERVC
jgi:hypothetical protein